MESLVWFNAVDMLNRGTFQLGATHARALMRQARGIKLLDVGIRSMSSRPSLPVIKAEDLDAKSQLIKMTDVMEGTKFNKWLVELGQPVKKKAPLAELSTEHYDYDYVSETDGLLAATFASKDMVVNAGDLLGVIALTEEALVPVQTRIRELLGHPPPTNATATTVLPAEAAPVPAASSHVAADVRNWLSGISQEYLDTYEPVLNREGFDTMDAVLTLTEKDLEEMKVLRGHRRVLLAAIEDAKKAREEAKREETPANIGS